MKLKINVDGKVYEVDVEVAADEQPHPGYVPPGGAPAAAAPGSAAQAQSAPETETVADEAKVCRSPIAGVVVKAPVQVGQEIQADDVLIVLEAMKMETVITAPISGKVAKINAKVGDSVQSGQVVIELE